MISFTTFMILVFVGLLAVLGLFVRILSAHPDVKRAGAVLTIARFFIGGFALIGIAYVLFHLLLRSETTVIVCDPKIPLTEQPCSSVDAVVEHDSMDGIIMINDTSFRLETEEIKNSPIKSCWVNWDGNPWSDDGEPCVDKATGEPRIVVPGPKGYEFRWE